MRRTIFALTALLAAVVWPAAAQHQHADPMAAAQAEAQPAPEPQAEAAPEEAPDPLDPIREKLLPGQRLSPLAMARTFVGDAYVRIVYSRPGRHGRDNIFGTAESGALVPWGELWRAGANEATEITVTGDVVFNEDGRLPAGTYSVFATPGPDRWTIHFNSDLGLSGTMRYDAATDSMQPAYDAAHDVLVIEATPRQAAEAEELFTISFDTGDAGTEMVWKWITTELRVPVKAAA